MKRSIFSIALIAIQVCLLLAFAKAQGQVEKKQVFEYRYICTSKSDSPPHQFSLPICPHIEDIEIPDMAFAFVPPKLICPDCKSSGGEQEVKNQSASFPLNNKSMVQVENKFGKVEVATWNQSQVKIDVEIVVHASTKEKAGMVMDKIDVSIKQSDDKNNIMAKTTISDLKIRDAGCDFSINYKVSLPANTPLVIKNSFGDVVLPDYPGKLDIDENYGNLTAGKLENKETNLRVSFGKARISKLQYGKLVVRYSGISLDNAGDINVADDFSKLEIDNAGKIDMASKYGDFRIGNIASLNGRSQFSKINIDKLKDVLDLDVQYCPDFRVSQVSTGFTSIKLDGGFSNFNLGFEEKAGFDFDINLSFGDLNVTKGLVKYEVNKTDNNNKSFKGSFGSSGKSSVNINAKYSQVKFAVVE